MIESKTPEYKREKWREWYSRNKSREYARSMQNKFGLSVDEIEVLFESQKSRCAICETHQDDLKKRLMVDHCHTSGKIRGLLCSNCNAAIGLLKDSPKILESAKRYLESI